MPPARLCLLLLTLALASCGSSPDISALCGVWASDDARELWWLDGDGLRGEGRTVQDGREQTFERLELRPAGRGHVYVAQPGDAPPTEFAPVDPRAAKFGPEQREPAAGVQHFVWANYAHDFPQEIHYLLAGDRLTAIVGGPEREIGWTFERVGPCEPGRPAR